MTVDKIFHKTTFKKALVEKRVPFLCERNEVVIMAEPKTIYCPKCERKVATWDGRSTINISVKCKKCNKLVVYDVENENVEIKEIPQRATSSGMRFY